MSSRTTAWRRARVWWSPLTGRRPRAHAMPCWTSGHPVLVEEYLAGPEVSLFAVCDGSDRGSVAAGPGFQAGRATGIPVRTPAAWAPTRRCRGRRPDLVDLVQRTVLDPVLAEMARRGTPFSGLLYAGLVLTAAGPKVIEFNCRFGDPETQVVLELLDTPLGALLAAAAAGDLAAVGPLTWRGAAAVTVVIAAENYPGPPVTGDVITGADGDGILHAGTQMAADGSVVSAGGRVLSVVATGVTTSRTATSRRRTTDCVGAGAGCRGSAPPDRHPPRPRAETAGCWSRGDRPETPDRVHCRPGRRLGPSDGRSVAVAAVLRHAGAGRRGSAGRTGAAACSTWPPVSRRRRPRRRCWLPRTRPWTVRSSATPRLQASRRCARPSPGTTAAATSWTSTRPRWWSPPDRPAAFCWPSWPRSTSAAGSGWPAPAIRRTETSCTRWDVRWSICRAGRRPGTSRRPAMIDGLGLDGSGRRQPGESHRNNAGPRRVGRTGDALRGNRGPADLRRDLPRHHAISGADVLQLATDRSRLRGQFVQQVLLDDGLADRLAAGAAQTWRR